MTPIENAVPGTPEFHYTQSHISARNCVERCIGVLKGRFQCLSKILRYAPQKVGNIVNACAILHNICTEGRLNEDFQIPQPRENQRGVVNINYQGNINRDGAQVRRNIVRQYF